MRASSLRGLGYGVLVAGLALSTLATTTIVGSAVSAATITDSAVTVSWASQHSGGYSSPNKDALQNMSFSVSQTNNIGHQGIEVSWTGGRGTTSSTPGHFDTNFVQIMQCWGEAMDDPTPEKCQFGSAPSSVTDLLGNDVGTRSLGTADPLFVKAQHPELRHPSDPMVYMYPFRSARAQDTRAFDYATIFDSSTTNEVDAARTGDNGEGRITFEVQTSLEAPQMGCGGDVTQSDGSTYTRPCWLVIVPRGDKNPNGSATDHLNPSLAGSPFSPSVWKDRVVIPLNFESVSQSCPIGQPEQRLVGDETMADAITSWQPGLCQSGITYGYSMIGDGEARTQITSDVSGASRLAFVSRPLSDTERGTNSITYAPVAQSALVFAYNIDYNVSRDADPTTQAKNGTRLSNLVLNQRLVAKLLTQSYRYDNPCNGQGDSVLQGNPMSITTDPEFISLNPDFLHWNQFYPEGLMVALGSSDANRDVWTWIRSSPDAVAFLNGTPDANGMRINPEYATLGLGTGQTLDTFPKADMSTCKQTTYPDDPGFGTLDMRPYYGDMQETAYRALRGDANVKTNWDPFKTPPGYKAIPAQPLGQRLMISLTDASAASRFGLEVAQLTNAAGEVVAPDNDSISAAIAHAVPTSVTGVVVPDAASTASGVYPLSQIVYAAINVCPIDAATGADYARLLTYAAGDGQTPGAARGLLPDGYVPLGDSQRSATQTVAASLSNVDALKSGCGASAAPVTTTSTEGGSSNSVTAQALPTPSPSPSSTATLGITKDHLGIDTSAAALGFAAGIPMCIAGPLMVRRARRKH